MTREYATEEQILESIVERLRDKIDEWSGDSVMLTDHPQPLKVPPSDTFCTVSAGDGTFPPEMFQGGGDLTCTEVCNIIVAPYSQHDLDSIDSLEHALLKAERGVLSRYKRQILKMLLKDWEPTYNGNELLRSMMRPAYSTKPEVLTVPGGMSFVTISLVFEVEFDWEL